MHKGDSSTADVLCWYPDSQLPKPTGISPVPISHITNHEHSKRRAIYAITGLKPLLILSEPGLNYRN